MGDIGTERREVEFEPLPARPSTVPRPAPAPEPRPEPQQPDPARPAAPTPA